MKRFLICSLCLVSLAGCLPTRNGTEFNDGSANNTTANNSNNTVANNTDNIANVSLPDMDMGGPNNVIPDMPPNNVTPDMPPNNVTPDLGPDACAPEDNMTFCMRQGAACGPFTSADNCGIMRTTDCGMCPGGAACNNNVCEGCVPEDDMTFCSRLGAECGQLSELDNCRVQRTVNCGGCAMDGVGCNLANACVETTCDDGLDNDNSQGADCDDPGCLGMRCGNGNRTCRANGDCRN
jgi:hypothetical protein